jgi:hypothetical protein
MYYEEFYNAQQGRVGISIDSGYYEPKNPSNPDDVAAAERALKFKVWKIMEVFMFEIL